MFYSIPNVASTSVTAIEKPWELACTIPEDLTDKEAWSRWIHAPVTNSHFLSMYEGMSPDFRVNDDNSPFACHGLLIDYDSVFNVEKDLAKIKEQTFCDFMPAYAIETFSHRMRLVFLFQSRVLLGGMKHAKAFQSHLAKRLNLNKWHAGLDTQATGNVTQYYHWGRKWYPIFPEFSIPDPQVQLWAFKSADGLSLLREAQGEAPEIPLERVALEVERKFPGRWRGPFELGLRGVRFWDPKADNATACIVRKDGMQCFTGTSPFVPWRDIFGKEFEEEYEAFRIAPLLKKSAYTGKKFFVQTGDDWLSVSKDDYTQRLRGMGFSVAKGRTETASEIDRIEIAVKTECKVEAAIPMLHFEPGIITYEGQKVLNTSVIKCLEPVAPVTEGPMTWDLGRKYFPFIHELLSTMFSDPSKENHPEQLDFLLSEVKYFYERAREFKPSPGHVLLFAGPPGKGKTLFSQEILAKLVAAGDRKGWADATDHLIGENKFTAELLASPIMLVDDATMVTDKTTIDRFTQRIKKYVSTCSATYEQKFDPQKGIPWFGRIVINCNTDSESMQVIPNMDMSVRNKICLFRCSDTIMQFHSRERNAELIRQELPFFARFLVDWGYPDHVLTSETRYGNIRTFHHPELLNESYQKGNQGQVMELLVSVIEFWKTKNPGTEAFVGTATQVYMDMSICCREAMKGLTPRSLAIALGHLSKTGMRIYRTYKDQETGVNLWRIDYDFLNMGSGKEGEKR